MEFFYEGTFLFSYSVRTVNDSTEGSPHDGFLGASWGFKEKEVNNNVSSVGEF